MTQTTDITGTIYFLAYFLVGLLSAYYLYQDAIKQKKPALNISAYSWALFGLIGSFYVIGVYWVMHHSSLVKTENDK